MLFSEVIGQEALKKQLVQVPKMEGLELSSKVSCQNAYHYGRENSKYKVAVLDFGIKKNILRSLQERDCYLKIFPMMSLLLSFQLYQKIVSAYDMLLSRIILMVHTVCFYVTCL